MSKKRVNITFDFEANMGPVKSAVAELQRNLGGISLPKDLATKFESLFSKLNNEMTEFEALTRSGFSDMADVRKAQTSFGRIQKILNRINIESSNIKGIEASKLVPKEVTDKVSELTKIWKELEKAQSKKKDGLAKKIEKQNDAISEQESALGRLKAKKEALNNENKTMGSLKGAIQAKKKADQKKLDKARADRTALESTRGGKSSAEYAALGQEITRLGSSIGAADKEIERLTTNINKNKTAVAGLDVEIGAAESELGNMRTKLASLEEIDIDSTELEELRKGLAEILGVKIDKIPTDLAKIKETIDGVPEKVLEASGAMKEITRATTKLETATDGAADGLDRVEDETKELSAAARDVENLKNSILQFFSLTNTVQLFKQTIQSALNTVKELDATMTEAAVVTEFSVGDMWEKLPEYSKQAQQLGVSINGMYQATTLYYQQGLKTNEAMTVGAETMKMAKIAAMDSTQATEAMTAALRGFNMELNETSAVRVNDVYSQLAAVTAADTSQIATAMEKTASIAASANMEFETTAAFLSQIIETTQEAPETAGTALKTIIARFSEVKNLREKGLTSGEDEEGEVIDVNKIQTALRSVGISMSDYFSGTEGLDQVLIKLAEKWDTLDFETQRYIATMAAGSRQQSRFIAMMSDYKRTTELVAAANNSAGASQKQYAKTLDSMESKLTRLKNAWDEFTMGLANNEVLKFGIDFLTNLLETINKITDSISGENGLAKSMISLLMVMGALKGGKALIGGVTEKFGMFGGPVKETITETPSEDGHSTVRTIVREPYKEGLAAGKEAGVGFTAGFRQSVNVAKKGGNFLFGLFSEGYGGAPDPDREKEAQAALRNKLDTVDPTTKSKNAAAIEKLNADLKENKISSKEAAKAMEAMGITLGETEIGALNASETSKKLTYSTQSVANGIGALGSVATGCGMALSLLASAMREMGDEETADSLQKVGNWVTAIGSMVTMAPQAVSGIKSLGKAFGTSGKTMSVWLIVAVAVVAALVAIGSAINKYMEARKLSNQIDEVNEKIGELNNAAQEAGEKLQAISDEEKNLKDLQKQFDGLTEGTKEWKQQLIKTNQQVLGLLEKYPQLSQYLETGENGELSIKDEGWEAITAQAQQQQAAAVMASASLQAQKSQLEEYQAFEEAISNQDRMKIEHERAISDQDSKDSTIGATAAVVGAGGAIGGAIVGSKIGAAIGTAIPIPVLGTAIGLAIGGLAGAGLGWIASEIADSSNNQENVEREITGGLTQKEFTDFAIEAQRAGLYMAQNNGTDEFKRKFQEQYEELFDNSEKFESVWESMENMGEEFDKLAAKAEGLRLAQETYAQTILSTAADANPYLANSKFSEQAVEGIASSYGEEMSEKTAAIAESYMTNREYVDKDGKPTEALIKEYAKATGLAEDEIRGKIKEDKLSATTMTQTVATKQTSDLGVLKMRKTAQELSKIEASSTDKKALKALQNLLTDEGKKMTAEDIAFIEKLEGGITKLLSNLGTSVEALGIDLQTLTSNFSYASETLKDAYSYLNEKNYETDALKEKIDGSIAQAFSKKIEATGLTASEEELQGFVSDINAAVDKMPRDEATQFMDILSNTDWTNSEQVNGLSESFQELGINLFEAGIDVEELEDRIKDMAKATSSLTFKEQAEQLRALFGIGQEILTGSGSIKMDEEKKKKLIETGEFSEDDFRQNPLNEGEWIYQGGKTRDAVNSVLESYAQEMYQDGLVAAEKAEKWNSVKGTEITGKEKAQTSISLDQQEFIKKMNSEGGIKVSWNRLMELGFVEENGGTLSSTYDWNQDGTVNDADIEWLRAFQDANDVNYLTIQSSGRTYTEPEAEYEPVGVNISAEDIAKGKVEIVADGYEFSDVDQMEDGKKYITQSNLDDIVMKLDLAPGAENLPPEQQIQLINDYYNASTQQDGKIGLLAEGAFRYNIPKAAADALSTTENFSGENEAAINSMKTLVGSYEVASQTIELYNEKLQEAGLSEQEAEVYSYQLALQIKMLQDRYKASAEQIGEYIEKMRQSSKDSDQYNTYIKQIGSSLENLYGIDPGDDWIKENEQLMIDWANGSEEAYAQVSSIMADFYMSSLIANNLFTTDQEIQFLDFITFMNQNPATATFNLDLTEFLKGVTFAENQIDGLQAYFESKGYALTFSELNNGQYSINSATRIDANTAMALSDKNDTEKWENPYDKFYNTLEKINEAMRERERLERRYQKMIKSGSVSANELNKNRQQELAVLQREAELQNDIIKGRKDQINQFIGEKGLGEYAYIGKNEFTGADELRIDWAKINAITDSEKGSEVEAYISQLEEWFGSIEDAQDSLWEIEDNTEELENRGKDEYLEMEQMIKDALVDSYQKQIDKLSEINQSINDGNAKMIEAMQSSIEEQRQARENQKVEDDIADKQNRLAYLQRDTSGANAMEILQLQKEIDEAQEDYTDTLIDQKIQDLQDQNDAAAEQRERQIDIAQQQLDHWVNTGEVWGRVEGIINNISADTDNILGDTALKALLGDSANFEGMSKVEQMDWMNKTNSTLADGLSWLKKEKTGTDTTKGSTNNPDLKTTQPTNPTKTEPEAQQKKTDNDIMRIQAYLKGSGEYKGTINGESSSDLDTAIDKYRGRRGIGENVDILKDMQSRTYSFVTGRPIKDDINSVINLLNDNGYNNYVDINGITWLSRRSAKREGIDPGKIGAIKMGNKYYPIDRFKTGGLADYTGPAWLDGTKSHPELVLNARDTQNFIQLKDILASLMSGKTETSGNSGDSIYDIDINVETIQNKEDLDTIAKYIEDKIVASASYRNNNLVKSRR